MIYLDNDLVYTLGDPDPLTDRVTGAVVTDATVTAQLLTTARAAIAGTSATLAHVSGGLYRGSVAASALAGLTPGQRVIRRYVAVSGGVTGTWEEPDTVARRPGG